MSEWKSFKELPYTGQQIIVIDDKVGAKECGVFVEISKEYYIGVLKYDAEGMGIKLTTHLIEMRFFTHWKEV